MLEVLGYQQQIVPLKIDNLTADTFSNSSLKEKRSKVWEMCLYLIKDRVKKRIYIYWSAGANNFVDYFTKHFSPSYQQQICPQYITKN